MDPYHSGTFPFIPSLLFPNSIHRHWMMLDMLGMTSLDVDILLVPVDPLIPTWNLLRQDRGDPQAGLRRPHLREAHRRCALGGSIGVVGMVVASQGLGPKEGLGPK